MDAPSLTPKQSTTVNGYLAPMRKSMCFDFRMKWTGLIVRTKSVIQQLWSHKASVFLISDHLQPQWIHVITINEYNIMQLNVKMFRILLGGCIFYGKLNFGRASRYVISTIGNKTVQTSARRDRRWAKPTAWGCLFPWRAR